MFVFHVPPAERECAQEDAMRVVPAAICQISMRDDGIEQTKVIERILGHLGVPTEIPEPRPARAPPLPL